MRHCASVCAGLRRSAFDMRSLCVLCVTRALLVRSCTFLVCLLCAGYAFRALFMRLASVGAYEFSNAIIKLPSLCGPRPFLVRCSCVARAVAIFIMRSEILIYFRFSNAHGTHN